MTAQLIDGTAVAKRVRSEVAEGVAAFREEHGRVPGLATVLVGEDPASEVYVRNKRRLAAEAGMQDLHRLVPADASEDDVAAVLRELAADDAVSGILLQLPLPKGLPSARLIDLIPPAKDVDGLTTASAGLLSRGAPGLRPCTPSGVMVLLEETGIDLSGATAVVVGRSELVGYPQGKLLLDRNATVTIAHSRTRDLVDVASRADVLVAAAGRPGLIGPEHVREGAVVIDVGIHRTPDGLVGDVRFDEVREKAGWLTPVPGGVGPMTIAMLLQNTLTAAKLQAG
jgi:methylenetetrahydrofolate dehydrogenase (NADP+) / methenyltetrahydrofolate cyclohydrolase